MEIVATLRLLGRHRAVVVLGALAALLVGLHLMYEITLSPPGLESRRAVSAEAVARFLVAGRNAPSFDLYPDISGTLGTRSVMLADLLATDESRHIVARRAGVPFDALAVVTPANADPPVQINFAVAAARAAASAGAPYVMNVSSDGEIPIATVNVAGPDQRTAARVASAASAALHRLLSERSPARHAPLVIEPLGPPVTTLEVTGPKRIVAVLAAIVVFALWCSVVVLVGGLARRWREARLAHALSAPGPSTT